MDYLVPTEELLLEMGVMNSKPVEEIFSALRLKHPTLDWCAFLSIFGKAEKDGKITSIDRGGKIYYLRS